MFYRAREYTPLDTLYSFFFWCLRRHRDNSFFVRRNTASNFTHANERLKGREKKLVVVGGDSQATDQTQTSTQILRLMCHQIKLSNSNLTPTLLPSNGTTSSIEFPLLRFVSNIYGLFFVKFLPSTNSEREIIFQMNRRNEQKCKKKNERKEEKKSREENAATQFVLQVIDRIAFGKIEPRNKSKIIHLLH